MHIKQEEVMSEIGRLPQKMFSNDASRSSKRREKTPTKLKQLLKRM